MREYSVPSYLERIATVHAAVDLFLNTPVRLSIWGATLNPVVINPLILRFHYRRISGNVLSPLSTSLPYLGAVYDTKWPPFGVLFYITLQEKDYYWSHTCNMRNNYYASDFAFFYLALISSVLFSIQWQLGSVFMCDLLNPGSSITITYQKRKTENVYPTTGPCNICKIIPFIFHTDSNVRTKAQTTHVYLSRRLILEVVKEKSITRNNNQ